MIVRFLIVAVPLCAVFAAGCRTKYREDLDYSYNVQQTWQLDELNFGEIVQFETVFWEPDDTVSLRELIVDDSIAGGRSVLEIGTGTGLISILCLQNGASRVVATDINPAAVANAMYNAAMLAPDETLDVRLVEKTSPQAYAVLEKDERFDLIISNPPWEDGIVAKPADHAFYDTGFVLMDSLLDELPNRLTPGGRCLLAYGHVPAIKRLLIEAEKRNFECKVLDDRDLDQLETDFLPGMLIEVRPPLKGVKVENGAFTSSSDQVASDKDTDDIGDDLPDASKNSSAKLPESVEP